MNKVSFQKILFDVKGNLFMKNPEKMTPEYTMICENEGKERAVADYIAGMTDNYCVKLFNELFMPIK